jgi:S1-C subfamily serine protease
MSVKLAERPAKGQDEYGSDRLTGAPSTTRPVDAQVPLGVTVREMDRRFVGRLEIPENVQGVIVQRVDPTGAARQALDRGFVILEVNRKPTPTVADYERIVAAAKPGDALAIYYYDPTVAERALVTVIVD